MDCNRLQKKIIYEIYVRSFQDSNNDGIGDLQGIKKRLLYLKHLGVDYLWLTPIFASPNYDLGYDCSDYWSINPEYGTMDDLKDLILKAGKNNLKIILDIVFNHTSTQHPWFLEAINNPESHYRDYYFFADHPLNNLGSQFGGSAWHEQNGTYYLGLFSKYQADLNWESPGLRQELKKILQSYLEMGVAGFRFDVISLFSKPSNWVDYPADESGYANFRYLSNGPKMEEYLAFIYDILQPYNAISLGEGCGLSLDQAKLYEKYLTHLLIFDVMNLDGSETYKWNEQKTDLADLAACLVDLTSDNNPQRPLFLNNHDQPRALSRFGNVHDPIHSATLLATLTYSLTGTPLIYQGEEIGMSNYPFTGPDLLDIESINAYQSASPQDKERILSAINQKGRDHGRTPMQWTHQLYAGFSNVKPWAPVNPNNGQINLDALSIGAQIHSYYLRLLQIIHEYGEIFQQPAKVNSIYPIFHLEKHLNFHHLIIVANLSEENLDSPVPYEKPLITNYPHSVHALRPSEIRIILHRGQ
jgi:oligo-1,6-glucosidase